jgi:hypothetical protein
MDIGSIVKTVLIVGGLFGAAVVFPVAREHYQVKSALEEAAVTCSKAQGRSGGTNQCVDVARNAAMQILGHDQILIHFDQVGDVITIHCEYDRTLPILGSPRHMKIDATGRYDKSASGFSTPG